MKVENSSKMASKSLMPSPFNNPVKSETNVVSNDNSTQNSSFAHTYTLDASNRPTLQ